MSLIVARYFWAHFSLNMIELQWALSSRARFRSFWKAQSVRSMLDHSEIRSGFTSRVSQHSGFVLAWDKKRGVELLINSISCARFACSGRARAFYVAWQIFGLLRVIVSHGHLVVIESSSLSSRINDWLDICWRITFMSGSTVQESIIFRKPLIIKFGEFCGQLVWCLKFYRLRWWCCLSCYTRFSLAKLSYQHRELLLHDSWIQFQRYGCRCCSFISLSRT